MNQAQLAYWQVKVLEKKEVFEASHISYEIALATASKITVENNTVTWDNDLEKERLAHGAVYEDKGGFVEFFLFPAIMLKAGLLKGE